MHLVYQQGRMGGKFSYQTMEPHDAITSDGATSFKCVFSFQVSNLDKYGTSHSDTTNQQLKRRHESWDSSRCKALDGLAWKDDYQRVECTLRENNFVNYSSLEMKTF